MLERDEAGIPLIHDPMVSEANVYTASDRVRLSDSLLSHFHGYMTRLVYRDTLYGKELRVRERMFRDITLAPNLPDVWKWGDLVVRTGNLGSVYEARNYAHTAWNYGHSLAYITGGLEFTRGQWHAMRWLIARGYRILMGHEPHVYAAGKAKRFGAITTSIVPMSYWSKVLGDYGFVFTIPRPLPRDESGKDAFYDDLYAKITGRKIPIVASDTDPFIEQKRKRGPIIAVPTFKRPSTAELFWSIVYNQ